jgi:hypothetical protein
VNRYDPPDVPAADRLRDLGHHFRELADRVREAVADAVGETLGRLARDAARRWLGRRQPGSPAHGRDRYDDRSPPNRDPWDDDPWEENEPERSKVPADIPATGDRIEPKIGRVLVTGLVWAGGWWLRRKYRTIAAVAAAVVAVATAAWPTTSSPALDTLGAAAEALSAHHALTAGADSLASD